MSALDGQNCRRLLVVTEGSTARADLVRQVEQAAGVAAQVCFDTVDMEPTMYQAVEGSRIVKEYRPDLVAAIGGRNVIDCAKAMVCFSGTNAALTAIPTAFGGGSEVTDSVLLTHNGRRHVLQNEAMRPRLAILDSRFAGRVSPEQVREQGFELLAGTLEVFAAGKGMLQQIHAREGFSAAWAALPAACAGNSAARQRLQMASVLAGMARDQANPGLCTALQNTLGIVFGLSRGKAAAVVLPVVIGCNGHAALDRYAQLARAAGVGGSREELCLRNLKMGLLRLRRELGLPGNLIQAGIDIRTVWNSGKRVVELTLEDPASRNNPVAVDDFLVRRILEEITGRF